MLVSLRHNVSSPITVYICYDDESDSTLAALESYGSAPFEIKTVKNKGRGAQRTVLTGFNAGRGKAAIFFPADDYYNAKIIDSMKQKFQDGCDLVCASRFMKGGTMVGCPLLKAVLVRLANFTLRLLGRFPTHDSTNGIRLYARKVIDQIAIESTQGFSFSLEYLVKCHRLGWKICEVPAGWFERTNGQSRFRVIGWLPAYLRWYFYAFATTYFRFGPASVLKKEPNLS